MRYNVRVKSEIEYGSQYSIDDIKNIIEKYNFDNSEGYYEDDLQNNIEIYFENILAALDIADEADKPLLNDLLEAANKCGGFAIIDLF